MLSRLTDSNPLPSRTDIGLRAKHYAALDRQCPQVGFIEVHSENCFGPGGKPLHFLERVRQQCPLSLRGVGLSLGTTDPSFTAPPWAAEART